MSSSFVIFCIQICLIQNALTQRVNANGPAMVNNGHQYGPNIGLGGPLQGPAQLGAVMNGPRMAPMGLNQALGPNGQIVPNGQTFAGMPTAQAFAGMPNQAISNGGKQKQMINGAGNPNQFYNGAGMPNSQYGGTGNGEVAVNGELPVSGMTSVTGQVPMTGKVVFNGNLPCNGIVTISGGCSSCGQNAQSFGQMPAYGKPYGY